MQEDLVALETAKLAKEKGFDWVCEYYYEIFDNPVTIQRFNNSNKEGYKQPSAPTHSLLQKWLRVVNKIHIHITEWEFEKWYFEITDGRNSPVKRVRTKIEDGIEWEFDSYEEALEVGLQEALKLIKIFKND